MTNKCETQGVILLASLTKVVGGYVMTSILNTNDTEVDVQQPLVELDDVDSAWDRSRSTEYEFRDREKDILTQLRVEHLNVEERKLLIQACPDYQDIFYLPGEKLSSTVSARHSISFEPGTETINTTAYRLPETQKVELHKQVKKSLQEGIIEESN